MTVLLPDLKAIRQPCITDLSYDRYNSKYQFSDFKNLVLIGKGANANKILVDRKPKNLEYWPQSTKKDIDKIFSYLIHFYHDLDTNLERLLNDINDPLFIRFICMFGALRNEYHWEALLRSWNSGYNTGARRYYSNDHFRFDVTGVSYLAYFDTHFSKTLFYSVGRQDQFLAQNTTGSLITGEAFKYDHLTNKDLLIVPFEGSPVSIVSGE